MNWFDIFVFLIIAIKVFFIIFSIIHIYLKEKGKTDSKLDQKIEYWKKRTEFLFIFLMSLLLIYLFNPRNSKINLINTETQILLYLFGFILIITADWSNFIHQSKWFSNFQEILGKV
jgi:phosphatidylglycerophosphate synthase